MARPTAAAKLKEANEKAENEAKKAAKEARKAKKAAEEVEQLKKQMVALKAVASATKGMKGGKSEAELAQMKAAIKDGIKNNVWSKFKFYPSNDEHIATLGIMVLEGAGLGKGWKEPEILAWCNENESLIANTFNEQRSYVGNILRGLAKKTFDASKAPGGMKMPTLADILKCAGRNLDLEKKADYDLFKWYWEEYCAQLPGCSSKWNEEKRHYQLLSTAAPENRPNQHYNTAQNEAFGLLAWENYVEGWVKQWELKYQHPGCNIRHKIKKPAGFEGNYEHRPAEKLLITYGDEFKTKYTQSDSGSSRLGGWSEEGKKQYMLYLKEVKKVRKDPKTLAFEEDFLKKLRAELGIEGKTHREQLLLKRRKRPRVEEEAPKEVVDTWAIDSDDDDEEEEEEDEDETGENGENADE